MALIMSKIEDMWQRAIKEHNNRDYHEAHELFEDIWLELEDRTEKDIVQTLAQADALAVHLSSGNLGAAQRLMRQLPELLQTFPVYYRNIGLIEFREWISQKVLTVPNAVNVSQVANKEPPNLFNCG